jgi:hypothetical protein
VLRNLSFQRAEEQRRDDAHEALVRAAVTRRQIAFSRARSALIENRRADAAVWLMQQFDLNCREAGELVDVSICDEEKSARRAFATPDE